MSSQQRHFASATSLVNTVTTSDVLYQITLSQRYLSTLWPRQMYCTKSHCLNVTCQHCDYVRCTVPYHIVSTSLVNAVTMPDVLYQITLY